VAEQAGLSQEEIGWAQQFESEDEKQAAALRFARDVVETRGKPSDEALEEAREAGYTDEHIMEIVATVALATFSNYRNETIKTEVDIPVVESIQSR
jgi:alkylhydroperoxidase family enzyme